MTKTQKYLPVTIAALVVYCSMAALAAAQGQAVILSGPELTRVIPAGFYFQGRSGPTQMRNAAAVRFGTGRHLLAGMVDTSGYADDVRARYEGFLITDSSITIGGSGLETGAYGFGFSNDGKLNILDLAGNQILSVSTAKDTSLKRPRPLVMIRSGSELRLYSGRDYAVIAVK
jgi:hypothetical protein